VLADCPAQSRDAALDLASASDDKRSMNLTALLVPALATQLHAVSGWLDKAEGFATERGESPDALLALRLAPDMFPLTTQLRFLAFQAQEPIYRLRGEAVPDVVLEVRQEGRDGGERPGIWSEARARVAEAAAFIATVSPDEFDGRDGDPIAHELPTGMIFDMTAGQYVRDWALPQAAFHQMIAYAILRQAGVPLGKVDYVPHMLGYLRSGTGPG
jgi:hypothetical protein